MRTTRRTKNVAATLPSSPPLSGAVEQVEQESVQVNVLEVFSSELSLSSGLTAVNVASAAACPPHALDPSLSGEPKLFDNAFRLETYLNLGQDAQEHFPSYFDPLSSNGAPSMDPMAFNASLDSPLELSPYDGTMEPSEMGSSPYFDPEDALHSPAFDWSYPLFPSIGSVARAGASNDGDGVSNEEGAVSPHEVSPVPASLNAFDELEPMDKEDSEYRPTTPAPSDDDYVPSTRTSRKRRSSSTAPRDPATHKRIFTGSRSTPATSLMPSDAPIQPRTYVLPSSTSRKALPIAVSRCLPRPTGTRRKKVPAIEEGAPEALELDEEIVMTVEAKRSQNTLAARKSRERKARYLQELEGRVEEQEGELGELRREVERLKRLCGEE